LAYTSPFTIQTSADASWLTDIPARRQLIVAESSPPPADWYSTSYGPQSYGPKNPQLYSVNKAQLGAPDLVKALQSDRGVPVEEVLINTPPEGVASATWSIQRLLSVAQQLIGTPYQHLHLPTFNPVLVTTPGSFTWRTVSANAKLQSSQQLLENESGTQDNPYCATYGVPSPGIDCTDFTAYLYNLALGHQLHSGPSNQVVFPQGGGGVGGMAAATVLDSTGRVVSPSFFYGPNYGQTVANAPGSLTSLLGKLQPGDLLYIGNQQQIVHIVVWLGSAGVLAGGDASPVPLVISSHDNTPAIFDTQDINMTPGATYGFPSDGDIAGHLPPPGVQILPFAANNWFYQDFQLAMRLL
jgi:cell wall-associated NlpC family hydrolase